LNNGIKKKKTSDKNPIQTVEDISEAAHWLQDNVWNDHKGFAVLECWNELLKGKRRWSQEEKIFFQQSVEF
jgi:hypothetical protein